MKRIGQRTWKSRSEAEANKERKRSIADTEINRNLEMKKQRTQIQEKEVCEILCNNVYFECHTLFLENEQEEEK